MIDVFAPAPVRVADVQEAVAAEFNVTRLDLISDRRGRAIALPRHIAFLLARELTTQTLPAIGRSFGDRDHTTILHGIARIKGLLQDRRPSVAGAIARAREHARRLAAARAGVALPREPSQLGLRLIDTAEPELAL